MSAFFTRPRAHLAIAMALLAAPSVAFANSGIGYFMVLLPVMAVALPPVIPLEAIVLMRMLKLPFKRALYLTFIANLWSTLAGIVIGIVFDVGIIALSGSAGPDPTRGLAMVMLVPMFFITWTIERRFIQKRLAETPVQRVRRATFFANLVSYAAMMVCAWIYMPETGTTLLRAYTTEAILVASSLKTPMLEFHANHKRFPSNIKELGDAVPTDSNHSASLDANGRITVRINRPSQPELRGKHVQVWPIPLGETVTWKCGSPDLNPRLLPARCRETTP